MLVAAICGQLLHLHPRSNVEALDRGSSDMARGQARKESVWDTCVRHLQQERCRFRMERKSDSPYVWIRQVEGGKRVARFSSRYFLADDDDHVRQCMAACLACHESGVWDRSIGGELNDELTWDSFARIVSKDICKRIKRQGSRKNALGHLKEIGSFTGPVSTHRLLQWLKERDPTEQPQAFRNRMETLGHVQAARHETGLNLDAVLREGRDMRPRGAAKKARERSKVQIHAIPSDQQMQDWLDQHDGHEQWLLALISTYGLRPSEAWHAEGINDRGWLVIPGDGKTKTRRHIAPPVPSAWVERYRLAENFERYQQEVNERWKIKWVDDEGTMIPSNNSEVTNALYRQLFYRSSGRRLWVGDVWLRPYDMRHAYAIRCFTSEDVRGNANEDFARWMGHSLEVHERDYLKFMSSTREDEALMNRFKDKGEAEPEAPAVDPAEWEAFQQFKAFQAFSQRSS